MQWCSSNSQISRLTCFDVVIIFIHRCFPCYFLRVVRNMRAQWYRKVARVPRVSNPSHRCIQRAAASSARVHQQHHNTPAARCNQQRVATRFGATSSEWRRFGATSSGALRSNQQRRASEQPAATRVGATSSDPLRSNLRRRSSARTCHFKPSLRPQPPAAGAKVIDRTIQITTSQPRCTHGPQRKYTGYMSKSSVHMYRLRVKIQC